MDEPAVFGMFAVEFIDAIHPVQKTGRDADFLGSDSVAVFQAGGCTRIDFKPVLYYGQGIEGGKPFLVEIQQNVFLPCIL